MTDSTRRTKRRYAHELYPHAEEYEVRPLSVEVPYLYAQAIGLETWGTGWFDPQSSADLRVAGQRTRHLLDARNMALLADAIQQGMVGDNAWRWAMERAWDYTGTWVYQRARHHGVDTDAIKPYPCGPEPDHHEHRSERDASGYRTVTPVEGKESDCPDCTEDIPEEGQ